MNRTGALHRDEMLNVARKNKANVRINDISTRIMGLADQAAIRADHIGVVSLSSLQRYRPNAAHQQLVTICSNQLNYVGPPGKDAGVAHLHLSDSSQRGAEGS